MFLFSSLSISALVFSESPVEHHDRHGDHDCRDNDTGQKEQDALPDLDLLEQEQAREVVNERIRKQKCTDRLNEERVDLERVLCKFTALRYEEVQVIHIAEPEG